MTDAAFDAGVDATLDAARRWADVDPDAATAAALRTTIAAAEAEAAGGTGPAVAELTTRFNGRLAFGTAGLRGPLGWGPRRMNRVLVRTVAAALAERVLADHDGTGATVVVGHDARHGSRDFALDTARVLAARGIRVVRFDEVAATPVVAFAVRHLGAAAGVVVTASHNPATDAGYKVYWGDGAQIVPPIDAEISDAIDRITEQGMVDEAMLAAADSPAIVTDDGSLRRAYTAMAAALVGPPATALRIVHTALHGVGAGALHDAFAAAGRSAPLDVAAQRDPDPDFPTAPFPNPEEPGAMDLAFAHATEVGADLVLANDPDADRLAVGVPGPHGWQRLTGDDVGALLGDHLCATTSGPGRLVATTIVSSTLLAAIAEHHGVAHATTLTGFKWIVRPAFADPDLRLIFGYEEALGYAVTDAVADKDGITAALVLVELAETLAAEGATLVDRLHQLAARHGLHRTAQRSVRVDGDDPLAVMRRSMAALRSSPPDAVAGRDVTHVVDHAAHPDPDLVTDAVRLDLDGGVRIIVRPSGTEPKVKIYGQLVATPEPTPPMAEQFAAADADLAAVLDRTAADLGLTGDPS